MGFFEFLFGPQPSKPAKPPVSSPAQRSGRTEGRPKPRPESSPTTQKPPSLRVQRTSQPAERIKPKPLGPFDKFVAAGLRAIRFIDKKTYRKALSGVLYRQSCIIATDGHRLYKENVPIPAHVDDVIIPPELFLAHRHFPVKTLSLSRDKKSLIVNGQQSCRLIDEKYPDIESITPKAFKFKISFDKRPLEDALRLAGESKQALFSTMVGNRLRMTVNQTVPPVIVAYKGQLESIAFAFNPDYLLGVLRNLDGDMVTLKGNSPMSAFVFQGDLPERTALLMPMRIVEEMRAAA